MPALTPTRKGKNKPAKEAIMATASVLSLLQRSVCALVLCWALSASAATPKTPFYGHQFDNTITLGQQELQLNGVGGRSVPVIFMRVFATALYLPELSHDPETILQMPGAKRIQIRMNYGVAGKEFKKALMRGIEKNHSPEQQAALAARTQAFAATIDSLGRVKSGDIINMDFLPEQGLVISVNGKTAGQAIAGADFYAAVLRIFIGKRPAEQEMKERILGLKR